MSIASKIWKKVNSISDIVNVAAHYETERKRLKGRTETYLNLLVLEKILSPEQKARICKELDEHVF